jgi:hypothetical protein
MCDNKKQDIMQQEEIEEMQNMLDFWLENMHISDWDTTIKVLDNGDYAINSELPQSHGENSIYDQLQISEIIIKKDSEFERECIVVHELSHIIPVPFLNMISKWYDFFPKIMHDMIQETVNDCNETVTHHITRALLSVKDAAYELGYNDAMREIGLTLPGGNKDETD